MHKLQLLKAGIVLSYASNIQRKLSFFFLFKSAVCQVELCLFIIVCCIAMAISRAHSFKQVSLIFFRDIVSLFSYVVKPTIILVIGHFLFSAKFCEILWKYQNSLEKGKFRGSARNSATHGKL